MASQADTTFDPFTETHFALTQNSEYRLRQIGDAMLTVADLLESAERDEAGPELEGSRVASIFRAFSYGVARVHAEGVFAFPGGQVHPAPLFIEDRI